MWIQPNTTVKILKNVPLDNQYENTMWFINDLAQYTAFNAFVKYTFQNPPSALTYQRVNRNTIRINRVADDLYDCNYMMFQNTAYGNKWFYAFILEVNYINDNVTEVVYEIDEIQTWLGIIVDGNLEECFIERQHAIRDDVGLNLQPEDVSLGEYKLSDFHIPSQFLTTNTSIVMALAIDYDTAQALIPTSAANRFRGCFTGCDYRVYPNTVAGAQTFKADCSYLTHQVPSKVDYIMGVFIAPTFLTYPRKSNDPSDPGSLTMASTDTIVSEEYVVTKKISGAIDGYTPRNNKLYTFPYNFLYVTNFQGMGKPFPYEYFKTTETGYTENDCIFELGGDINGNVNVTAYPTFYKGQINNWDEMVTASGYPQCAWNADTYKAWLAQAKGLGALALAGVGIAAGFGALGAVSTGLAASEYMQATNIPSSGTDLMTTTQGVMYTPPRTNLGMDIANGGLSTMKRIGQKARVPLYGLAASVMHKGFNAFINPIEQRGNQSGSALLADNVLGFGFGNKHITGQYAARIDAFFDMYGYAQNIIAKPDINCRKHWTYVKTIGCTLTGEIPVDSARKIGEIFDNGIRFWKDINHVGQYSYYEQDPNVPIVI